MHPTDCCGMQLFIPAWDTCFWHKSPHIGELGARSKYLGHERVIATNIIPWALITYLCSRYIFLAQKFLYYGMDYGYMPAHVYIHIRLSMNGFRIRMQVYMREWFLNIHRFSVMCVLMSLCKMYYASNDKHKTVQSYIPVNGVKLGAKLGSHLTQCRYYCQCKAAVSFDHIWFHANSNVTYCGRQWHYHDCLCPGPFESPGYQQLWHWQCRINRSLFFTRKDSH